MTEATRTTAENTATDAAASPIARVVVGVDDSDQARAALSWAVVWAQHTGARVHALAAWSPSAHVVAGPEIGAGAMVTGMLTDEQLAAQAEHWLEATIAAVPISAEQVVDREVVNGDAATALLDAARDAELLVVGNSGRGALAGAVTGSVALRCAHHARCPVVLVPDPDVRIDH